MKGENFQRDVGILETSSTQTPFLRSGVFAF